MVSSSSGSSSPAKRNVHFIAFPALHLFTATSNLELQPHLAHGLIQKNLQFLYNAIRLQTHVLGRRRAGAIVSLAGGTCRSIVHVSLVSRFLLNLLRDGSGCAPQFRYHRCVPRPQSSQ